MCSAFESNNINLQRGRSTLGSLCVRVRVSKTWAGLVIIEIGPVNTTSAARLRENSCLAAAAVRFGKTHAKVATVCVWSCRLGAPRTSKAVR